MVLTLARTAGRARLDLAIVIRMCRSRMSSGHESYFQVVGARPGFRISETAGRRRPSSLRELRSKRQFEQTETQVANVTSRGSQARARSPAAMYDAMRNYVHQFLFFLVFYFSHGAFTLGLLFFPARAQGARKSWREKAGNG